MDGTEIGKHELSSFVNLKETINRKLESTEDAKSIDGTMYAMAVLSNFSDPYLMKSNPDIEIPAMMECAELILQMKLPDDLRLAFESLRDKDIEGFKNRLEPVKPQETVRTTNSTNSGCMVVILAIVIATFVYLL